MRILSIITVALNEAKNIPRLKQSIDSLVIPDGISVETVLVDNGSQDETVRIACKHGYHVLASAPNLNLASCRNVGIESSSGDWLAFIDADCEIDKDWLLSMEPFLQLDSAILIGWPVRPPSPATWVQRAWQTHWSQKTNLVEMQYDRQVVAHDAYRLICTNNMAFSRAVSDMLGGFDISLHTGEDSDFAIRASNAKVNVLGLPQMGVIHHGEPATLKAFYRQQTWHMNLSAYNTAIQGFKVPRGLNALLFTCLFGVLLLVFAMSITMFCVSTEIIFLPFIFLLPTFLLLLATRTSFRAQKPRQLLPLCVVYFVFGIARLAKVLGIVRTDRSWRVSCKLHSGQGKTNAVDA
ncbi:glycosyltransferase [Bythopirellula goksoeyrii]|uniref:Putative glycosyl transferase n=1 Tax=Bythopirellula goksoeyrii TaxID=1400387 RepID=A0A5B9QEH8_9BACT|nr:glycosyltransferase [Bythopirellula goksoeyrii]QEG36040.1 putative glycosyl transferase [Bythopirellula goksoeyrii]